MTSEHLKNAYKQALRTSHYRNALKLSVEISRREQIVEDHWLNKTRDCGECGNVSRMTDTTPRADPEDAGFAPIVKQYQFVCQNPKCQARSSIIDKPDNPWTLLRQTIRDPEPLPPYEYPEEDYEYFVGDDRPF